MLRQHRRSIIQQNMEAFIITDKVIAQEHMLNPATRAKYIKKYDVPSNNLHIRKITQLTHKPHIKIIPLTAPRNKEVLLQLCQPLTKKNSRISTPQLERYFTLVSEGWRQGPRKNKLGLLVKKFEPHSQQYDADFKAVSRRAPSWTLLGKKNQPQTFIRSSQQPDLLKENILGVCNQVSRSVQLGELLERQEQRLQGEGKGLLGQSFEPKLHYSPTDLGRCTTNIFKKYNLDKDPNFKKFLADLQNENS